MFENRNQSNQLKRKGNAFLRKKQHKKAKDVYLEALNIDESNEGVLANLSLI